MCILSIQCERADSDRHFIPKFRDRQSWMTEKYNMMDRFKSTKKKENRHINEKERKVFQSNYVR